MKKEILCFYNTLNDELNFEVLQTVLNGYTVRTTAEINEAKQLFENTSFEIVLVDFTQNDGREFLNFVMANNTQQKIITMSDNFECSESLGCQFCIENYHRKRIFRPIKLKELTDVIKNFGEQSCTYMHKFNNILNLLHKIIEEFNHFSYDSEKKVIYPKEGISESALLEEILEITTLLQEKDIKFQVDEYYKINLFIN